MMKFTECNPDVSNFARSFKSIGYNHYSAILDLIDNAIAAGSTRIWIDYEQSKKNIVDVRVSDNGKGMNEENLFEAMRIASADPSAKRSLDDLGKFGLGMKLASFSQTDIFSVISKTETSQVHGYQWDLNLVRKENRWLLHQITTPKFARPKSQGTELTLFDVFREVEVNLEQVVGKMQTHIAVVYQRIKGIKFFINDKEIEAIDPFFSSSVASNVSPEELIQIGDVKLTVQSHQIPHHNKMQTEDKLIFAEISDIGMGPGVYVYRKKRLIAWSGWEGLGKNVRINDLYRMSINCSDDADELFNIEVKKSQIAITDNRLRAILKASIFNFSDVARRPYKSRASLALRDLADIWLLERSSSEKVHFVLNKQSEFVKKFKKGSIELSELLEAIEGTLPYESLLYYLSLDKIDNQLVNQKKLEAAEFMYKNGLMNEMELNKIKNRYAS
jgi:hypothetical protein